MMWGFYPDATMLLIIPAFILSLYAQAKVKSNFDKFSRVANAAGLTGADVARKILAGAGITDVTIASLPTSSLGDHYNPR
ncbi:MAG: zinc metallopeptidase, partial [Clostridia bacterium]|nr:zinc metallopeptidase [Clostridia bacterium]